MSSKQKMTLANLVVNMIALALVDYFLTGVTFGGLSSILVAAVLLMILNKIVKPILEVISLPMTCMTLGLFEIFICAVIVKMVDGLMPSVHFASFRQYILAVIIIAIVNGLFGEKEE